MRIIVDSGSSKADWAFINQENQHRLYVTKGLNPLFHNRGQLRSIVSSNECSTEIDHEKISDIFFYGAGCIDDLHKEKIKDSLGDLFPNAEWTIHSDIWAAAKATCQNNPGIVAILGTGANTCYYDGEQISDRIPALGFALGDEGSGAFLGKMLLKAYYYRNLPAHITSLLEAQYNLNRSDVLNEIYQSKTPNVYLASYSHFLFQQRNDDYIRRLIFDAFDQLFINQLSKYDQADRLDIHFVGSIAFHFSDILKEVGQKNNMSIGKILRKPIEALVKYHINEQNE